MESLADIRLFVEAANLGGISAAGRKLNLSPAAASARLVRLEAKLHVRLFERTTRSLRLTEEGRRYLEHCQLAVQSLEDAHSALHVGQSVVRGRVRISATSDFGRHVLKGWLDEFNKLYPDVVLSVALTDSKVHLLNDEIDLAIRFGTAEDSSFVARPLATNCRLLCASPQYLATHGTPVHPDDLSRFDFILRGAVGTSAADWHFTRHNENRVFTLPAAKTRETNDGALAREWALDGHGLLMKSVWDISADVKAGRLAIVLADWTTPPRPVYAFYQRSRYMAPRIRVLLDFLAECFDRALPEITAILTQ